MFAYSLEFSIEFAESVLSGPLPSREILLLLLLLIAQFLKMTTALKMIAGLALIKSTSSNVGVTISCVKSGLGGGG